jgi:CheY-like chemotaxis protein
VATPRRAIPPLPAAVKEAVRAVGPRTERAAAELPTTKPGADGASMRPHDGPGPALAVASARSAGRTPDASGLVPSPKATPVDAEKAPAGPKPRILALDDEPSIRAFLRTALTRHGMDCQPFADGAHALEGLREANFDVMLIDHRMPLMSGTEFYEAAIAYRPELATRAIFMSGDVLNPDLRGFATQRGIRLLAKPFDIEAVIRIVGEALEANKTADA